MMQPLRLSLIPGTTALMQRRPPMKFVSIIPAEHFDWYLFNGPAAANTRVARDSQDGSTIKSSTSRLQAQGGDCE